MNELQPIESAPKDGMEVLLWNGRKMEKGLYEAWTVKPGWIWMSEGFEVKPTHWMPLPDPPK